MAQRPLDKLLPQAVALVLGLGVLAAVLAGVVADVATGAPSGASGFGAAVMLPLALFAAIIGFAIGYGAGAWLRRRNLNPSVPLRPYRVVLGFALGAATVIGAAAGARPVLRHERLHRPGVLADGGGVEKIAQPLQCARREPAQVICDPARPDAHALTWNGRELALRCREGDVRLSDADTATIARLDLSGYRYMRDVFASPLRGSDGRQAMVIAARLTARGARAMITVFDADARLVYQELAEGDSGGDARLEICRSDEGDAFAFGTGGPTTYRLR